MASSSGTNDVWSLPEVIDYFRADPEIKGIMSEDEVKGIINVQADWVKLVRAALEYQGFDPRVILRQLLRNRKSYEAQRNEKIQWDLSNVGNDLKWTSESDPKNEFSNQETISKDVNFMITVFLARNNHIDKIIKKARGGVEDILNMLKEKYVIDDEVHSSGTSLDSRTTTLPKIAGVFPGTAVRMFHDKTVKEIVTYELFPGSSKPGTRAICCPLLPSVCPVTLMDTEGHKFSTAAPYIVTRRDVGTRVSARVRATLDRSNILHKSAASTNTADAHKLGYQRSRACARLAGRQWSRVMGSLIVLQ